MECNAPHLPEIGHAASRSLFRYWESIRGERSAPLRSDISLREIRHLLPWMFISERKFGDAAHRLRLAGTGVCQLWGDNMTDKDLFASWSKFERTTMCKLLDSALIDNHPFVMRCRARTARDVSVTLEILGLPVQADDTGSTQVLGLVVPFQDSELLRGERLDSFHLVSVRIIWIEPLPKNRASLSHPAGQLQSHLKLIRGGRVD
jgi:hypothetical protein